MQEPQKRFGRNLRRLIKEQGYRTLELFAHEHGFDRGYIAKLVRGEVEPKLNNMVKIARALGVTLNDMHPILYPMKRKRK